MAAAPTVRRALVPNNSMKDGRQVVVVVGRVIFTSSPPKKNKKCHLQVTSDFVLPIANTDPALGRAAVCIELQKSERRWWHSIY